MVKKNSDTNHLDRSALVLLLLSALVLAATVAGCSSSSTGTSKTQPAAPQLQTIRIPVEGMSCVSCAASVKRALKGIEGVQQVEVSLENREAVVRFSPEKVTTDRLESAINGLGYKAGKSRVAESK